MNPMGDLPTIGQRAPSFHARLANGKMLQLSDYHGQPLVLIFLRHLA